MASREKNRHQERQEPQERIEKGSNQSKLVTQKSSEQLNSKTGNNYENGNLFKRKEKTLIDPDLKNKNTRWQLDQGKPQSGLFNKNTDYQNNKEQPFGMPNKESQSEQTQNCTSIIDEIEKHDVRKQVVFWKGKFKELCFLQMSNSQAYEPKDLQLENDKEVSGSNHFKDNTWMYTVELTTGQETNAGTTAKVFVILNGQNVNHTEGRAELNIADLEKDTTEIFHVPFTKNQTPLKCLLIGHDGSGDSPDWFCEKITVKCHRTGLKQTFPCNEWIHKDGQRYRVLKEIKRKRTTHAHYELSKTYPYEITITTGNDKNAGTEAKVFVDLHGEHTQSSGKLSLPRGKFDRGKSHKFHKVLPVMLSPLTSVDIGHDNSGESPDWYCEQVVVYSHTTGFKQTFTCQKWLHKKEDQDDLQTKLFENTELPASNIHTGNLTSGQISKKDGRQNNDGYYGMFQYDITITTGRQENAGTGAKTFITLFGTTSSSGRLPLSHCQLEPVISVKFHRYVDTDLGVIYKIEIGHDNSGDDPDWFLEKVTVYCVTTNTKHVFHCKDWLSKTKGDCSTVRILYENRDINDEVLRDMCKQHGRKSIQVAEACEDIRRQILSCSPSFIDVWPTYRPAAPDSIVFLVFTENTSVTNFDPPEFLNTFEIVRRNNGEYSEEDMEVCKTDVHYRFGDKQNEKHLTHILQKNSCHYMKKHSNLNIMTASAVKSKGFAFGPHRVDQIPCIVFTVRVKGFIPIQEDELPSKIGIYKTDVREGAFELYNDPEQYLQRLKIGCSIGVDTNNPDLGGTGGTLGAFVDLDPMGERIGCITSAHTVFSENNLAKIGNLGAKSDNNFEHHTVYQPAPLLVPISNFNLPFGYVSSAVYAKGGNGLTGVEVGLITITDKSRNPDNGTFPLVADGFTIDSQLNYTSGKIHTNIPDHIGQCTVYKYGAKTGLTRGAFKLSGGAVRQTGSTDLYSTFQTKCELHNQIEICSVVDIPVFDQNHPQSLNFKHFAEPGDSGALVLLETNDPENAHRDLRAIGILTGGATNRAVFYVTPIWEILRALNLNMKLKNFDDQTNMETDCDESQILENTSELLEGNKTDANVEEKIGIFKNEVGENVGKMGESISMVENQVAKVNEKIEKVERNVKEIIKNEISNVDEKVDKISSDMATKTDMKDLATKTDMNNISNVLQILLKASLTQVNTTQSNLTQETNTQANISSADITEPNNTQTNNTKGNLSEANIIGTNNTDSNIAISYSPGIAIPEQTIPRQTTQRKQHT